MGLHISLFCFFLHPIPIAIQLFQNQIETSFFKKQKTRSHIYIYIFPLNWLFYWFFFVTKFASVFIFLSGRCEINFIFIHQQQIHPPRPIMIGCIFQSFLFFIFFQKSHAFSEIIEGNPNPDNDDVTIRCTEQSLVSGCLIKCMDHRDCYNTDIFCYPGVPCRIECIPRSPDDNLVCRSMNAHGNNASTMDVFVNSNSYRTAYESKIFASANGPTYIYLSGDGNYLFRWANIYGHDGQLLSITANGISGTSTMKYSNIHCPSLDGNDTPLCEFNCLNGSDCSKYLRIYTNNGMPADLQIHCDDASTCANLQVFCDAGSCEMELNGQAWECTGGANQCIIPTQAPYADIYLRLFIQKYVRTQNRTKNPTTSPSMPSVSPTEGPTGNPSEQPCESMLVHIFLIIACMSLK